MVAVAGGLRRRFETMLARIAEGDIPQIRHLGALWLAGSAALGATTWLCFRLGLTSDTVAFAYLMLIVLLSLLDSFISSVVFSVVAIALLDYFFIDPIFTLSIGSAKDLLTLGAFVVTSLVVTSLVRRMRVLATTHREQARLLNLTHDSILVRDTDDVITYWNRGAEELYGWTKAETMGKVTHDLLKTQFPVPLEDIKRTLVQTGRWDGELLHTRRDGTQVVVSSRWSLQRDSAGRPLATLETNNDITGRKRAQDALSRSQAAYLAEAQKLSATGSFSWHVANGTVVWSDQSFRIFDYDPASDPSVEAIFQRVHPEDVARVRDTLNRAARDKAGFDFEHRLLMPDGSVKHLRIVASPVNDEPGELQFVGALMDVTAGKRAQEQLQQAQAELAYVTRITTLGELAASIAHEVNQPLAAIVTSGDASLRFLALNPPQLGEVRDAVKRIVSDGKRAGEIVQRIRGLTKKTQPQSSELDINGVVSEGVSLVQREVTSHRVALRLELANGLPAILGDKVQLQQVIINLIINAVQAVAGTDGRPRNLAVRSNRGDAGDVIVAVEDSGPGIDPASAGHLFDAFFTTKPNGMGMGLSICRTIIEAHGGRVWATGNASGGATFLFSLPPAAPPPPKAGVPAGASPA